MNKRGGLYAVTIGLMALSLLAATIFSTQGMIQQEKSEDFIAVMSDVRMTWENTTLVFDDALAGAVANNTCAALDQTTLESKYLTPAINSMNSKLVPGVQCSYANGNLVIGATADYTADITCSRELLEDGKTVFKAEFTKNVTFSAPC